MSVFASSKIQEKFCTIDGKKVFYLEAGAGEPLVLVHAWPVCSQMFLPSINILAQKYHVFAPDFPGFGESDSTASGGNYPSLVEFLRQFLIVHQLFRVDLCGVSLGAAICLLFSLQYPHLVNKLVINSPPIYHLTQKKRYRLLRCLSLRFPTFLGSVVDYVKANPITKMYYTRRDNYYDSDPNFFPQFFDKCRRNQSQAIVHTFTQIVGSDLRHYLTAIRPETLLLVADQDYSELLADAKFLATRYPQIKFISVPNVNHRFAISQPRLFASHILDFLSQNDS